MQLSLFPPKTKSENSASSHAIPAFPADRIRLKTILESHIPEKSIAYIADWLMNERIQLKITRNRSSKLGDYRHPKSGQPARISVNHDLNKYSFLITLVHELAHHLAFKETSINHFPLHFRRKKLTKPHGREWQSHCRKLMAPLLSEEIFPAEIIDSLTPYLENPKASTAADTKLMRALKKYDRTDGSEFLENLPFNAVFHLRDGRTFFKKEKIRKRFRCISSKDGRIYLFNPLAQVYPWRKEN